MSVEAVSYLTAIMKSFPTMWPIKGDSPKSIICKTTGMGALIRLLGDFHRHMPRCIAEEIRSVEKQCVCDSYVDYAINYFSQLSSNVEQLFSLNPEVGEFCSTGGSGLELKLYKKMKDLIFNH